jgi:hypothetical protein
MMNKKARVCISSPPNRNYRVAEIFFGSEQWAELSQEGDNLQLEIYPGQNGQPRSVSFQDPVDSLSEAREKLQGTTSKTQSDKSSEDRFAFRLSRVEAETLRECMTERLAAEGFDNNYSLNERGKLLEALIDRFYLDA